MLSLLSSFAAGIVTVGGFAPFNLYPLAILGLAVLFWQWHHASSVRASFLTGFVYGLGLFGAGVNWIFISLHK